MLCQIEFVIYLGAEAFAVIAVLEVSSLALSLLDLLDDGEEDSVLAVITVVLRAPAVSVVAADVVTSLNIEDKQNELKCKM